MKVEVTDLRVNPPLDVQNASLKPQKWRPGSGHVTPSG